MKINIFCQNLKNVIWIVSARNYRGKYLTSYQKKISTNQIKSKSSPLSNKEAVSIIANLSIANDMKLSNQQPEDNGDENRNPDLIEASRAYLTADPEYRKLLFYGSENQEITSTNYNCHGCGSNLNCKSLNSPGFLPYEVYHKNHDNEEFMKNVLCMRCFYLSSDLDPLDIILDNDIYYEIVTKQLKQYASGVVILLADMSDLPFSIPPDLDLELLKNYRVILLGNKIDLLSRPTKHMQWYQQCLLDAAKQRGIPSENIEFVHLISAKTCELIEAFVDRILSPKFMRNEPIFMIGSTNTGKSSVFNRLLKSDLCKTIVKSHVRQAMTSNLAGTTLNLLRFPMTNVSALLMNRRQTAKEMMSRGQLGSSVNAKYPLLESSTIIQNKARVQSFTELATYAYDRRKILSNIFDEHSMRLEFDAGYKFNEAKITTNKWFYDTPGFINPDQLINYLPKEELDKLYATEQMDIPRIYVLKAGLSITMQNLARIDILESRQQLYLCVHARLPVEIVDTSDVERYFEENDHFTLFSFKKNLSPALLAKIRSAVPDFNPNDDPLPAMVPVDMDIATEGFHTTSADVVLSSIGWVGISGIDNDTCKIRAWTPAAIGCAKRTPSLIPGAIRRRSHRRAHSREFAVN